MTAKDREKYLKDFTYRTEEDAIATLYLKSMEGYYGKSPFIPRKVFENNWASVMIRSAARRKLEEHFKKQR